MPCLCRPGKKPKAHLGTEASLVMFVAVRLVQRHHVVPHFDQDLDGAEAGREPAGVLLYLELLANIRKHVELC